MNFYKVSVAGPTMQSEIFVNIHNLLDPDYPTNISTSGDDQSLENYLTQIEFEPIGHIGKTIEIKLTVFTD